MFEQIRELISKKQQNQTDRGTEKPATNDPKRANIAVCALLIEAAHFDEDFHEKEQEAILRLIKEKFSLTTEEANELISIADEERKKSIDLWHFTELINKNYSKEEKIELLEMLWQVVYADNFLDGNEDYLMHKLSKLLKLEHKDLIEAKVKNNA